MDPPAVPGLPTSLNLIRAIRFPIKMIILWKSDPCCDRNKLSSDIGETLPAPWEPFRSRRELDFIRGAIKPDPRPYATTTKLETKSMLSIIAVEPLERPKQPQAVGYFYTFNFILIRTDRLTFCCLNLIRVHFHDKELLFIVKILPPLCILQDYIKSSYVGTRKEKDEHCKSIVIGNVH